MARKIKAHLMSQNSQRGKVKAGGSEMISRFTEHQYIDVTSKWRQVHGSENSNFHLLPTFLSSHHICLARTF